MNVLNDITFSDSKFVEEEWRDELITFALDNEKHYFDDKCTYLTSQVPDGGSSGAANTMSLKPFRQTIQEFSCENTKSAKLVSLVTNAATKRSFVSTINLNQHAVVHPRFIHGIVHIQFAVELVGIDLLDDDVVSYGLLAEQDGVYFKCERSIVNLNRSSKNWKRYVCMNIGTTDFKAISNSEKTINFTRTGSPIHFGYITVSSTSKSRTQIITGIDHFSVTVRAGLDEVDCFNLSNTIEAQHKKVINMSEQVVRCCKQRDEDEKRIEDLQRKLKMIETAFNNLRLATSQMGNNREPTKKRTPKIVETIDDDFVEISVITEQPTITIDFVSSDKVDDHTYDFPSDDCISDEESEIDDINDYAPSTDDVTSNISDSPSPIVAPIQPEPTPQEVLEVRPDSIPEVKQPELNLPQQPKPRSPAVQSPTSTRTKPVSHQNRNRASPDHALIDDDEWEVLSNTKHKFSKEKIIDPGNEI